MLCTGQNFGVTAVLLPPSNQFLLIFCVEIYTATFEGIFRKKSEITIPGLLHINMEFWSK
jgi:hypothetical protein